ncbi:MAG: DUF5685 family protein [Eubacteriales bacterium]|jgi:hypothetical protein
MFGYITIDRSELKGKDLDKYHAYYCGVCRDIKASCGEAARLTLTYDMTFLAILLNSLYEGTDERTEERCILRPVRPAQVIRNKYTAYAADMNILLVYHNLDDNWIDDRNFASKAASQVIRRSYLKTAAKYPRQTKAIRHYLKALHATEESGERNPEVAAKETGELMAEIYQYCDDGWTDLMREMGFYIGKFIYLMDAWDDVEKDIKKHDYNPFLSWYEESAGDDFDQRAARLMTMQASAATRAFEQLPCLQDVDILRNVLYSGIWVKFREKQNKKKNTENARRDDI